MKPRDLIPRANWSKVNWTIFWIGVGLLALIWLPDPYWIVAVLGASLIGWQLGNAFGEWIREG